jgi:O-antigen/teichoic acid export membrane protein
VFGSQFLAALYSFAGPIVVGMTAGDRAAGLYSAVERVAAALMAALTLTHTAAYPRLAASYGAARNDYLHLVRLVVGLHGAAVTGLGLLLFVFFEPVSRFVLGEATVETAWLLGLSWLWLASGIFGPLLTGYLTVSGPRGEIMRVTWHVLLVSLPAGCVAAWAFGGAGWLAALVMGQLLVLARALAAYRRETTAMQTL